MCFDHFPGAESGGGRDGVAQVSCLWCISTGHGSHSPCESEKEEVGYLAGAYSSQSVLSWGKSCGVIMFAITWKMSWVGPCGNSRVMENQCKT